MEETTERGLNALRALAQHAPMTIDDALSALRDFHANVARNHPLAPKLGVLIEALERTASPDEVRRLAGACLRLHALPSPDDDWRPPPYDPTWRPARAMSVGGGATDRYSGESWFYVLEWHLERLRQVVCATVAFVIDGDGQLIASVGDPVALSNIDMLTTAAMKHGGALDVLRVGQSWSHWSSPHIGLSVTLLDDKLLRVLVWDDTEPPEGHAARVAVWDEAMARIIAEVPLPTIGPEHLDALFGD